MADSCLWVHLVWDSLCFLDLDVCYLAPVRKIFSDPFLQIILLSLSLSFFPFWTPIKSMLVCFMLFHKFLKLPSFFKISFSILFEWLLLPCPPGHLPVLLFHLVCYSISPVYFSVHVLYSSTLWLLFGSLLCAISLCGSSPCVLHSSPEFAEHLYDHYFELFVRCITSLHFIRFCFFFFFLKFYLVPSFRTFSSVSSFCLTLSVCFYYYAKQLSQSWRTISVWIWPSYPFGGSRNSATSPVLLRVNCFICNCIFVVLFVTVLRKWVQDHLTLPS